MYQYYYQHISTPEYKNKEFVNYIRSIHYESIGPVLWEEVNENCKKFEKKQHWSVFKIWDVHSSGLAISHLIDNRDKNARYLIEIPIYGGDLKRGLIPRYLAKKAMRFHENDLVFVSWKTFLWNPIQMDYFLSRNKAYDEDLCWSMMDDIRTPTKEEIEEYKKL